MQTSVNRQIGKAHSRLLHDRYSMTIFRNAKGAEIYLVGGYIRDIFLGREGVERDFVIRGSDSGFLKKIAFSLNGRLIDIGKSRLHRIVLKNNIHIDFTLLKKSIEDDLSERDFTINAMAWSPDAGIIDLFGGSSDCSKRIIRMVTRANFLDDPVRILRAYRLSEELSCRIDPLTRSALKDLSSRIIQTKSERITSEFYKILNSDNPSDMLKKMLYDGLLTQIISLSYNEFRSRIKEIDKINACFYKTHLRNKLRFSCLFSENLRYNGLLNLEILLSDMPATMLNLSSRIKRRLRQIRNAKKILADEKSIERGTLYDIFMAADEATIDFLVINGMTDYLPETERFAASRTRGILTHHEIRMHTGVKEGKHLGLIIEALKKAVFVQTVKTRVQAKKFVKSFGINI